MKLKSGQSHGDTPRESNMDRILYNAVTSKENPHLWPHSRIYSGYSASVVMMQYGNADITLDIIRGIDAIRTGAHALSWGLCESGHFCILML